ncbi:MAG: Cytochrome c-type biogenesis protein CcmH [Alphaproteobacteria bacterium]|nr:MAG: Cytochrome c-type biogenesis protein CcmH [Alphaproteobacteria bacterium]
MARLVLLFGLLLTPAQALDPGEALADAALETRARALSQELRCMVCQNQSIDDSDAPLAKDLRQFVRARLLAGDSDSAIRAAVVERYGEFALFRPRVAPHTLALWAMPLIILLFGAGMAWRLVGKSARQNTSTPRQ